MAWICWSKKQSKKKSRNIYCCCRWQCFTLERAVLRVRISVAAGCQLSLPAWTAAIRVCWLLPRQTTAASFHTKCHCGLVSLAISLLAEEITEMVREEMHQRSLHPIAVDVAFKCFLLQGKVGRGIYTSFQEFLLSKFLQLIYDLTGITLLSWCTGVWSKLMIFSWVASIQEETWAGSWFWRSRLVVWRQWEFGSKTQAHSCSSLSFSLCMGLSLLNKQNKKNEFQSSSRCGDGTWTRIESVVSLRNQ